MKKIAKKIMIYSLAGIMQIGLGATIIHASPLHIDGSQQIVQLDDSYHHNDDRERIENNRHEREMRRHEHETDRDWHERQEQEKQRHEHEMHEIERQHNGW